MSDTKFLNRFKRSQDDGLNLKNAISNMPHVNIYCPYTYTLGVTIVQWTITS